MYAEQLKNNRKQFIQEYTREINNIFNADCMNNKEFIDQFSGIITLTDNRIKDNILTIVERYINSRNTKISRWKRSLISDTVKQLEERKD